MDFLIHKWARLFLLLSGQMVMMILSFVLAVYLHHDGGFPEIISATLPFLLLPLVLIKLACFGLMKLFTGWWRFVSLPDLVALVKANMLGSGVFFAFLTITSMAEVVSPSILILDGLLCFLFMSGARVSVRIACEHFCTFCKSSDQETTRILIVGSGAAAQSIAKESRLNPKLNWHVIGFVDQDPKRLNLRFQGVPVVAPVSELNNLLKTKAIDKVILANPTLCVKEMRQIISLCQAAGVKSKILPNVGAIMNGEVSVQHVRDVQLEDLLGRPQAELDVTNIRRYLGSKRVLVTGAAGSIGSEICRQIAVFGATSIILFDNAETPLFRVERELEKEFPQVELFPSLSDVRDRNKVNHVFDQYRPEVVFHAAAYKHVPMSEQNPIAAIENNVVGTQVLVDAAHRFRVDHFVMVSTDKAVNPTNIMGASKRAAEIYVQTLARHSQTSIVTVRFGNVLGSNGSVVPIFQEQIRHGGPVTVTDREATRFFMTIPEAVQLVLQAGSMGHGGEIFILDMGEQVKILHLAEELIRLSGMTPYQDIDIVFSGLRQGEKLHEELLLASEGVKPTSHEKICVANAICHDIVSLQRLIDNLEQACHAIDRNQVLAILQVMVPEYAPDYRIPIDLSEYLKAPPQRGATQPLVAVDQAGGHLAHSGLH